MYRFIGIVITLVLCVSISTGQILFEEYFTDGNLTLDWFDGWGLGNDMTVKAVTENPSGDGWVGYLSNAGMVGTALAGASLLKDYSVEADIYTAVRTTSGGPYQGLVARWDTTTRYYYALICDFDNTQRIRLSFNESATPNVIHTWVGDEIPGGVPTVSGWHKLKLTLIGDQIWAYFDDIELPDCPFTYVGSERGFFGVYCFSMGTDSVLCDDIIVTEEMGIEEDVYVADNILLSVYPTPAVENIWVDYTLPKRGDVSLKIYNIQGQEVTSLYNGTRDAGNYSTVWERTDVTNGIYFLHLSTDYGEITRRILVLK